MTSQWVHVSAFTMFCIYQHLGELSSAEGGETSLSRAAENKERDGGCRSEDKERGGTERNGGERKRGCKGHQTIPGKGTESKNISDIRKLTR